MKRVVIAMGYADYYMCDEDNCVGVGVINNKGESYIKLSEKNANKIHGTKGKLVWEITKG